MQGIEEFDVILHIPHTSSTRSPPFLSENSHNPVFCENLLHPSFPQAQNLSFSFCNQAFEIKRKSIFEGVARNYERHAERTLASQEIMRFRKLA